MKIHTSLVIVVAATFLAGCCTLHPKGPAYGHEQEFRQQVEASIPVQKWGYKIQDIRFSDDFEKALVFFETPGGKRQEVIFEDDGFHRYHGQVTDHVRWNSGVSSEDFIQDIVITFPDREP